MEIAGRFAEHVIAFLRAHDTSYCLTVAHDG